MRNGIRTSVVSDWMTIISFVCWAASGVGFLHRLMNPRITVPGISGVARIEAILIVGLCAAAAHALLWAISERVAGWNHHEGPTGLLPQGWSAVVLSLTMTVPLVALPPLYGALFHTTIVYTGHALAGVCVIVAAAFAHFIAYGSKSVGFPGLKRLVFPQDSTSVVRALSMEAIYAVLHFGSIVLVYRLVQREYAGIHEDVLVPTVLSMLVWLLGILTFYFVKYPDSVRDEKTVEQRRVIHGLLLMLALQAGILM